ncbi:ADP-ribosylglycohydrolase family protein [uncultured Varibaculum sp.]|uniref:ADP-ribosylglycohydrolase family protein n=1 Tax=uncultured Varibaculum sp. TaxID=413896 RepID=UPI0027D97BED|nr:ADP-ribosylglycohydrolase family protein [uncultured Varibaculum sp.]
MYQGNFPAGTCVLLTPQQPLTGMRRIHRSCHHASSFREAIETAVSFGGDSATYAALTGTVAGAAYGEKAIPAEWLAKLKGCYYLEKVAERFQQIDRRFYPG